MPQDSQRTAQVATDAEDLTQRYCVPLSSLTAPIEVGEIRLSVYMAVVSVAITLSFHLKHQPTDHELRIAKPLGAVFWGLSVLMLGLGLGNYIRTVNQYSRRAAIVQTGWKTQLSLGVLATSIVGTCIILLIIANTDIGRDWQQAKLTLLWIP